MRTASGLAMVVVLILLLGAAGGAMKLYVDRQSMADVINEYGQTLADLPQSSPQASQAFMAAADNARAGRFAEAKSELQRGRAAMSQAGAMPAIPGMPQLPGIFGAQEETEAGGEAAPTPEQIEEALQSLPENARPFFAQRRELFRRALALSMAARRVAPDKWEAHRAKILEAAAAGNESKVEEAMATARRELGLGRAGGAERRQGRLPLPGGGAGPGGIPGGPGMSGGPNMSSDQVGMAIQQARQMLAGAQAMGLDTGNIGDILDRAERELEAGRAERAGEALREAFQTAQRMMAGGGGQRRSGRGAAGSPSGPPRVAMGRPGASGAGRTGGMPAGRPQGTPGMGMWPLWPFGGGPGGAAQGPQTGMLPDVLGPVRSAMERESDVLEAIMEDIENASVALRERNQEQVREILAGARNKVASITKQREKLQRELTVQQPSSPQVAPSQRPTASERPAGQGPTGRRGGRSATWGRTPAETSGQFPQPAPMPWMMPGLGLGGLPNFEAVHDVLGQALDEARRMSDEEYERDREGAIQRLIWGLLAAVMNQGGGFDFMTPPPQGSAALPPLAVPSEEPRDNATRSELEEQIRNRLRLLQEPCSALEQIGVDLTQVQTGLAQARDAVNGGRLIEAARIVNQVADMVWQLVEANRPQLDPLMGPP